jgi:hypothetical protein
MREVYNKESMNYTIIVEAGYKLEIEGDNLTEVIVEALKASRMLEAASDLNPNPLTPQDVQSLRAKLEAARGA